MNIRFDKCDHWASTESRVQLLKLYRKYIIKIKLCASLSINNVSIETNVFAFQTVFVLCRSFVLFLNDCPIKMTDARWKLTHIFYFEGDSRK